MFPQQWSSPCGNQCTHKYAALMQIPCKCLPAPTLALSLREGISPENNAYRPKLQNFRHGCLYCMKMVAPGIRVMYNHQDFGLWAIVGVTHLMTRSTSFVGLHMVMVVHIYWMHALFYHRTSGLCPYWRVFCKKGCDADGESWEECLAECEEICYKDPVFKDQQWSAYIDRSPGADNHSSECFHACVAGCGYKFSVPSETVDQVHPKRPVKPCPESKLPPIPVECNEDPEDMPSTSA